MTISKAELKAMTDRVRLGLGKFVRAYFKDEYRDHLGASEIGDPCWRALWYSFRWVAPMQFRDTIDRETGEVTETSDEKEERMRRLFARGHAEEERLVSYLRGAGLEVVTEDPNSEPDETGRRKQFRIIDHEHCGGHFGGSLDGFVRWPGEETMIGEFKTHGIKSYARLEQKGLDKAKPMHVAQMNVYGTKTNVRLALYVPIRKDDDNFGQLQVREIDRNEGAKLIQKAAKVIRSGKPLDRLHREASAFECQWCDYQKQCHNAAPAITVNCRNCRHVEPIAGAAWKCNAHGLTIPAEVIPKGCDRYMPVEL